MRISDWSSDVCSSDLVSGFGNVDGFEFMLQDRSNGSMKHLDTTAQHFIGALMQREEIAFAFTTFAANNPQYEIVVDEKRTKQLGVNVGDLLETLQIYFGSAFISDFNRFGKFYRVIAQADVQYRTDPTSLDDIYVKNKDGEMVAVNSKIGRAHDHTSELQSLMRISYALFCLKKKQ